MKFDQLLERVIVATEAIKGVGKGNHELRSQAKPEFVPQSYIKTSEVDKSDKDLSAVKSGSINDPRDLSEIKSAFNEIISTLSSVSDKQELGGPLVSILERYYSAYYERRSRQSTLDKTRVRKEDEYNALRDEAEGAATNLSNVTFECFSDLLAALKKFPKLSHATHILVKLQEFVKSADKAESARLGKILQDFGTRMKSLGIRSSESKPALTVNTSQGKQNAAKEAGTFKGLDKKIKDVFFAKANGWERADELVAKLKNDISGMAIDTADKEELMNSLNTNERRARMIYTDILKKYSQG